MHVNPVIKQIVESYKPIWALGHASALFEWDLETCMPLDGSKSRGFAQAEVALMTQQRILNLAEPVTRAEQLDNLTEYEKGMIRAIKRDLEYFLKIPPDLVEELHKTATEATVVWREARRKSDFSLFRPHLEKVMELKRREAEKLEFEGHPYNALLDLFEEKLTTEDVDRIFSSLLPDLKRILSKILSSGSFTNEHELEEIEYKEEAMKEVNREVLRILDMPDKRFRMDTSTHPFTSGLSLDDVRITTRYEGKNFKETIFSVIHECGHALYDLQIDHNLEYTPIAGGASLGIHESQSRFWENMIGRSRGFTKLLYPTLRKNLTFMSQFSEEDVYRYFNLVRPSLIRVAADEVTYNFHIAIRYEIEKKLIGGEATVSEVPAIWDDMTEEYLGVRPKKQAEGALQDVHWSGGMVGYFPTYTLGNVIAAMVNDRLREDLKVEDVVRRGEMAPIRNWLRDKIHRWGSTYSPKELQEKIFRETYNPKHLLDYLEQKYLV